MFAGTRDSRQQRREDGGESPLSSARCLGQASYSIANPRRPAGGDPDRVLPPNYTKQPNPMTGRRLPPGSVSRDRRPKFNWDILGHLTWRLTIAKSSSAKMCRLPGW